MQKAAAKQLAAAAMAAGQKYRDYADDITGKPWKYQPLGFEALGGFAEPSRCLIDTIAKRMRDHSTDGALRAATKLTMTRTISCIIARWGADLVMHRLQPKEQLDTDC